MRTFMPIAMPIDWLHKLRHLALTLAFCLLVAALQYGFNPTWPFEIPLVYSVCIGLPTWALIDFGRHFVPSAAHNGWPQGIAGLALPVVGIVLGYLLGTLAANQWFGWDSWGVHARSYLPTSILITVTAGAAGTFFFYSKNKANYLQSKVAQAHNLATEARLKLLETQLEPHMLFNTLANLRVLIQTDPERAQTMLDHIIAYLRATLGASRTGNQTLQQEFERLGDYLELMLVRMGARLHYTLSLPPELAQHPVPSMLLQPLVENSIQHGLEPKVEGGSVTVSARRQGDLLVLEVQDTGLGFDTTTLPPQTAGTGFGLAQVRERLAVAYGAQATIDLIAGSAGGTRASIHIPYQL